MQKESDKESESERVRKEGGVREDLDLDLFIHIASYTPASHK